MDRARVVAVVLACAACAPISGEVSSHELNSDLDTFALTVRVPPSYATSPERTYSWVLQLDGRVPSLNEFDTTARLASEQNLDVVIVGINSATGEGPGRGRLRDYTIPADLAPDQWGGTGGAPAFRVLVRDRIIPFIEQNYRVKPDVSKRALFGHSLGGLFGAYCFTEEPLFGAIVSASPSLVYDAGRMHGVIDSMPVTARTPSTLLMTAGILEGPEMVVPMRTFARQAREKNFAGLEVSEETFPVDHIGSVEPSFRAGLQLLHRLEWDAP